MKVKVIPNVIDALGTFPKGLIKGLEDLETKGTNEDHPDYSVIKTGQNIEKSPVDLRRLSLSLKLLWGCSRGVMVKVMDYGIVVSEFVLQSRYYVHFRVNTLGKGMNPLILPAMDKIIPLLFF